MTDATSFGTPECSLPKPFGSEQSFGSSNRSQMSVASSVTKYETIILGNRELKRQWQGVSLESISQQIEEAASKGKFRATALIHAPFLIDLR